MWRHILGTLLFALILAPASGCIEMTQTITLNPDGRGKVKIDTLMASDLNFNVAPDFPAKENTLDEKKHAATVKFLTKRMGISAWKDVSVKWAPDGRLHFIATAYFDQLSDLTDPKTDAPMSFQADREKNGSLKITTRKKPADPNKKPPSDPATMSDKELDDYVLQERVNYQRTKPILVAFLADLKLTTVFRLPGKAVDIKGFKKESDKVVSYKLDGNEVLAAIKKFMAQDNAALKKFMKDNKSGELLEKISVPGFEADASVIVQDPGKDQFDYDREVKEARAAYPALRKKLGLDDSVPLPGGTP
jgi:hypothetical protein